MRVVSLVTRRLRWSLDGRGAAKARDSRESIIVELDGGGRGEAAPLPGVSRDSLEECARAIAKFAALLPLTIASLEDALDAAATIEAPAARFAIESALLDQLGLLPVYRGDIAYVVDTVGEARAALAAGAAALKLKVSPGHTAHVRPIAAVLHEERARGHDSRPVMLRLDANRSFTHEQTRALLAELHDLPIEFLEEPCTDLGSLPRQHIPIAADESLAHGATPPADIYVLKPSVLGGFRACLELARGRDVVVTHALEGPIGRRAVAAVAAMVSSPRPAGIAGGSPARAIVATPITDAIAAFATGAPLGIIHERATRDEQSRQRRLLEETPLLAGTRVVLFTSGSTGAPKPIVLTRAQIDGAIAASAKHLGWRSGDRWLLALSLAHAGGLAVVARCLAANVPIEIAGSDLAASLARCTLASLVPTQLAMLLDDPAWRPAPQLRAILLGGAAAPRALLERAAARGVPFLTTYGMTETFGQVATAPIDRAGDPDAPMMPLPGVEIIADPIVRVRGPMVNGELVTRDLGRIDERGALVILGRADDVIITGGENVHPATVEAAVTATPGVRAAIAFGVDDPTWGQVIGVAIVVDRSFDLASARAAWATRPAHERVRRLAIVDALPLLPTGKPDRRAVQLLAASHFL